MGGLSGEQLIFFAILLVGFGLLLTEWIRTDLVAILILLALALSGVLTPEQALSGFGSEPAIVVAAVFVLSGALHHAGVSEIIGRWIGGLAGSGFSRIVAVVMPSVAALSAFTHHLTTTAVMLPVVLNLAREREIPASKLLMPLSFAASLGTTITIIGAPAFLIASDVLRRGGGTGLGVFSIAPIGISLSLVGTAFVLLLGRFLLPSRTGADASAPSGLRDYFTEISILDDSPLLGKSPDELERDPGHQLRVVGWVRGGRTVDPRASRSVLRAGDVLLVRIDPDELATVRATRGIELRPVVEYADSAANTAEGGEGRLVQAVIAPGSGLRGQTLADLDFHRRYGAVVVGLWRRNGWLRDELSRIRLRAGDVLVLQGPDDAIVRAADDPAFLMMVPFQGEPRARRKAALAAAIMLLTIAAAASNLVSIEIAALGGAAAAVLLGCVTAAQAYRSIDARIYVFIAGALPLGLAMEETGASGVMAGWLAGWATGMHPTVVLAILFALVGVLTQFMSDAATTALLAPVALALARSLGHAPEAYVVTVAMAAVASFLTPIGHHGNLLVYGPGGYRFVDFLRVGAPLTLVVGAVVVTLAPILWPL